MQVSLMSEGPQPSLGVEVYYSLPFRGLHLYVLYLAEKKRRGCSVGTAFQHYIKEFMICKWTNKKY